MMHTTDQHIVQCGCRSVGECTHNLFAEDAALRACVAEFAEALKVKLVHKSRRGKSGWDDPSWSREDIIRQLVAHIEKGDMVDVAAFAMFAWNQRDWHPQRPATRPGRTSTGDRP